VAKIKSVSVVPLNGRNYPTGKVQCRLVLLSKNGLLGIVNKEEVDPNRDHAEAHTKFKMQRQRSLLIMVL